MPEVTKTLGDIIKEYRKEHKMSQTQFAKESGVSKAYVTMLEKNVRPDTGKPPVPSLDTIVRLAKFMDRDSFELMRDVGIDVHEKERQLQKPAVSARTSELKAFKHIPLTQQNLIDAVSERRVLILPFRLPTRGTIVYVPSPKYGMSVGCHVSNAIGGIFTAESEITGEFEFCLYDIGRTVFVSRADSDASMRAKE